MKVIRPATEPTKLIKSGRILKSAPGNLSK